MKHWIISIALFLMYAVPCEARGGRHRDDSGVNIIITILIIISFVIAGWLKKPNFNHRIWLEWTASESSALIVRASVIFTIFVDMVLLYKCFINSGLTIGQQFFMCVLCIPLITFLIVFVGFFIAAFSEAKWS
jgi:hypothetical protein